MTADIHGLSGAYAVDALDDVERAEFEQHLAQCAECQDEVASLRAAAVELTHATAMAPPAGLRESVLRQISTVRPLPPPTAPDSPEQPAGSGTVTDLGARRRPTPFLWLAAAAAAVALAIGGLVWSPWDTEPPPSATEQVIRAEDAERYERAVDGAKAPIVRRVWLRQAVIIAENMPAAPEGKDFQVWFQNPDGTMVSAGLMPHEDKPTVTVPLQGDASKFTGAGITLEPAGGSRQPTSPPVVLFEFS